VPLSFQRGRKRGLPNSTAMEPTSLPKGLFPHNSMCSKRQEMKLKWHLREFSLK
jgi:hypothetical protein